MRILAPSAAWLECLHICNARFRILSDRTFPKMSAFHCDRNDLLWEDHLHLNFKLVPFLQLGTGEGGSKPSLEFRHAHKESGASGCTHSSPSTPGSVCFTGINSFTFLQSLGRNKPLLQFRKHEQRGYKSYPKSPSQYNPECGFDLLF